MKASKLKQNYQKNLERASILALIGIIFIVMAFKRYESGVVEVILKEIEFEVVKVPITEQKAKEKPPARPSMPIPTEDEDIPLDETIENTDIMLTLDEPPPMPEQEEEETPMFVPYDVRPAIVGGYAELARNLHYPEIARKAGIEGDVTILALISKQGEILQTRVVKSLGNNGCDEAAIKAIKSVKWTPAYQRDRPVQVWLSVPIKFRLK